MERSRYESIVRAFAGRHLLVIGDLMTDEYLWGNASRVSPESPVMVVDVERESSVPGGAANVVNNLLALGAQVSVVGVVGADPAGEALRQALADEGAEVGGIVVDPSRPTTRKTRVVARSQQVLRVDREKTDHISDAVAAKLADAIASRIGGAHAVAISDYNKGVLTPPLARAAVDAARSAARPLTANTKPANAHALAGATLVQLNQSEARATASLGSSGRRRARFDRADDVHELDASGSALRRELDVQMLLVTRGARGLALWRSDGQPIHVAAHVVEVYDEAGAGDTVFSGVSLALACEAPIEEALAVANHAASCVVRKVGVATVTAAELLADWPER